MAGVRRFPDRVVAAVPAPRYTLDGLLAGVTEQNLHGEVETGDAVGGEAW